MTVEAPVVWEGAESLADRLVPLDSIVRFPGNPRRGDTEAIARSLGRFGQQRAVLVQKGTNYIVAGNHLFDAAHLDVVLLSPAKGNEEEVRIPFTHIAVDWTDLDDTEARAYVVADNQVATLGHNDPDALAEFLRDLQNRSAIDDALGFTSEALDAALRGTVPEVDPDETPAVPEPRDVWVQPGQMFAMGPHRLIVGDSTDPATLDRLMGDKVAGMIWTDPPYGVDYVGKTEEALVIENDGHDSEALDVLLRSAFTAALPHIAKGRAIYVAAPSGDQHPVFQKVLQDLGVFRQTLVWVKDVFVMGRSDYHYRHEFIHYGWKPGAKHYFVSDRTLDTVLEVDRPKASRDHPTAKPVALIEQNLLNSSKRGEIVLDMFAGGGSTMAACQKNERVAYMVELEPQYAQVILERYETLTGGKAEAL